MTAKNATPRYVMLSRVVEQVREKWVTKKDPMSRRQLRSLSRDLKAWGDTVIYENRQLREVVAASISHRLALGFNYTKSRFDQIHRITNYGD